MPTIYNSQFFADRAEEDKRKAHEAHDARFLTSTYEVYAEAVTYGEETLKVIYEILDQLAEQTQQAWVPGRGREEIPDVEQQLIATLNAPFGVPGGQIVELASIKPTSYYPMPIAMMGLRSLMTRMSKEMHSPEVRGWIDIVKSGWGIVDSETRKLLESKKEIEACRTLRERARKPALGSNAQLVRLGRPPKGKRGINRKAPSWISDRLHGLSEEDADAAWKQRVVLIALRKGLRRTSQPDAKTIARRAWYKALKQQRELWVYAREAAMMGKVERLRTKLANNNMDLMSITKTEVDLLRDYAKVEIDIDADERELIKEDVEEWVLKTEKLKAKYLELAPPPKRMVIVEIKPPPAKKEEEKEEEDSDFYDSDSD